MITHLDADAVRDEARAGEQARRLEGPEP